MICISVIVCCYNDGRFLRRALDSLLQQSLPRDQFELVLVNDGSSDDTENVALSFQETLNLKYLKNGLNQGLPASCNLALRQASGKYTIRLDADDFFESTILERMSAVLPSNDTDLVYSDRWEFYEASGETRYVRLEPFSIFRLIACGTMFLTERLLEIGGYRRLFWEEYDLYMRYLMNAKTEPFYIPEALYRYHIRPGSMTADHERMNEGWKELKALWPAAQLAKFGPLPLNK
jgi:glycosyltransferase involved in cell wall biosynthesis